MLLGHCRIPAKVSILQTMPSSRPTIVAAVAVILGIVTAGCATQAADTAATPTPHAKMSVPTELVLTVDTSQVVLTISNGDRVLTFSLLQLAQLPQRSFTIMEPFTEQEHTYSGVPLQDLLTAAGISADQLIETTALNHYVYTDAARVFSDALLATAEDGAAIPIENGGPTRIVFPSGSPQAANLSAWNWGLAEISAQAT